MVSRLVVASLVVFLPCVAHAQGRGPGRGMTAPAGHPAVIAPRVMAHVSQPVVRPALPAARITVRPGTVRARTMAPAARIVRRTGGARRIVRRDEIVCVPSFLPAPGLGFDEPHVIATRGASTICTPGGFQVPFFFPFFGGGFFLPSSPVVSEEAAGPDAQPEENQTEAQDPARRTRDARPVSQPAAETARGDVREAEQFVFVRRDGTLIFAVAYAWEGGILRYVTSEGLRRSVPRDALDLGATQQFNEQRGLNFRLPA